jgi:lipopolysaccharide transport system permease protein
MRIGVVTVCRIEKLDGAFTMREFSASPIEMFRSCWLNKVLIVASAKRDVLGRYRGSALGILWSFFNPLFMLAVYTFVFSLVFKARWGVGSESKVEFALVLFAGLIVFNLFSECINRAPTIVLSNQNYVKKVVYPLEILPVIVFLSAFFHFLISLAVWLLAYMVFFGLPDVSVIYLPLIIIPFSFFILGISWVLSSLGVFIRDIAQFIGLVTTALLFMSPIFYPVTALPEEYRSLLYANPLTPVIEQCRNILFWGKPPDFLLLGICWLVSMGIAWLGFIWFQKTRKGFADVI